MTEDKTLRDTEAEKRSETEVPENADVQTDSEREQPSLEQPDTSLYDRLYAEVSGDEDSPQPEDYGEKADEGRKTEETASDPEENRTESAGWSRENAGKAEQGSGQQEEQSGKAEEAAPEPEQRTAEPGPEPAGQAAGAGTDRKPGSRFFRFFTGEGKYIREQAVLSRIDNEHLMDYLLLEQKRYESEQKHRDERGKQILSAFQLAVSLAAIVAVIGFLKDEPTVLVNILYIIGIIAAAWLWKMKK